MGHPQKFSLKTEASSPSEIYDMGFKLILLARLGLRLEPLLKKKDKKEPGPKRCVKHLRADIQ